jgi:hypothetical protein
MLVRSHKISTGHIKTGLCKGKVVPLLLFYGASCQEGVLGSGDIAQAFSTAVLEGDEWSVSYRDSFNRRERTPGIHWIGGWMSPRAGLDAVV